MTKDAAPTVEHRLLTLFQELGITRAHIAARMEGDWLGLITQCPERVASLSLLCPLALESRAAMQLASRMLVITGDRGASAERVQNALGIVDGAAKFTLGDYEALMWSDLAVERTDQIAAAMLDFLARTGDDHAIPPVRLPEGEGTAAGISYQVRGAGPPLVLMPLLLAPSQWEPLVPALSQHYCTIELGGAFLGIVAALEARGRSVYLGMIRTLLDIAAIQPGETVLDVGCGSGVVIREVARRTAGANPLLAVDVSPYFLREARQLARQEGHGDQIEFREGRAEALPLPDGSVDVALSSTVAEEGDADGMLAELIRVTKPGGRIGVIVRATDIPEWVNAPLGAATKAKVEAPGLFGAGVVPSGCADASLYARFRAAGLTDLHLFPQLTAVNPDDPRFPMFRQQALGALAGDEVAEWRRAVAEAEAAGTLFIAMPHHCAVGTKR
jgi:SAM-dependent methyltransferase